VIVFHPFVNLVELPFVYERDEVFGVGIVMLVELVAEESVGLLVYIAFGGIEGVFGSGV
jgi:hypothetical protein